MKAISIQLLAVTDSAVEEIVERLQELADSGVAYSIEFSFYNDVQNPLTYLEKQPDRFLTKQ